MSKGYIIWGAGYFVKITCVVCVISLFWPGNVRDWAIFACYPVCMSWVVHYHHEAFILFIWIPVGSCCIFVVRGRIVEIQARQG